jgi:hypothetical protein
MELETSKYTYDGFYRGKVLDTNDPDKLGRIKLEIFGIFDNIKPEFLPWAIPAAPLGSGAGLDFGNFFVPEIGSFVWVFFERGDFRQPVYFAEAQTALHGIPEEAKTNYPNRKVMKTKSGIIIYIDNSTKDININHPSGAYINIDGAGNIKISGTTIHLNP